MRLHKQALFLANIQLGQGSMAARAILTACDRLNGILSNLDSKTSVLLRVNAMVVAALAYVLIINGSDLLQVGNSTLRLLGLVVGVWPKNWSDRRTISKSRPATLFLDAPSGIGSGSR